MHEPAPTLIHAAPAAGVMTAAVARRYGGPDVVAIDQVAVPEPDDRQVLVRVEATSLNALDWHFVTGTPYFIRLLNGLRRPKRTIHGADVAGVVVATGSDVTRLRVGDAVFGETGGGGLGAHLVAEEDSLVHKPDGVSFDAAAATPVAGLTAIQGLRTHGAVGSGDAVLVNGAAGGVGTFAVQIAVALGAEVTAVCSTRNVEMVRRLGAARVVDYTTDDVVALGDRYDVVLDNVGNRTPAECVELVKPGGRYVMVSGPKSNPWIDPIPHLVRMRLAFRGPHATFHQFTASPNVEDLTALAGWLDSGEVVPEIDRVITLDGVRDAIAEIGTGHARAKIVMHPVRSAT